MFRLLKTVLLLLIAIAGGWLLYHRKQIENPGDAFRLAKSQLSGINVSGPVQLGRFAEPAVSDTVKIASFNLKRPLTGDSMALLADIVRGFDVVAIQFSEENPVIVGVGQQPSQVPRGGINWIDSLVEQINATDLRYRCIIDRSSNSTGQAMIFDSASVQVDRSHWYTVNDPGNLLRREPMVAWFRTTKVRNEQAFTFTLANIQLDSRRPDRELEYIAELFRAIRKDGRGEDDVIIAGDFNAGDRGLQQIQSRGGLTWVISNTPTDTRCVAQYDNLVFSATATTEFTGRGGVLDFMKRYNLRMHDALEVSSRMPVWAEFSIYEGGISDRFADEFGPSREQVR